MLGRFLWTYISCKLMDDDIEKEQRLTDMYYNSKRIRTWFTC